MSTSSAAVLSVEWADAVGRFRVAKAALRSAALEGRLLPGSALDHELDQVDSRMADLEAALASRTGGLADLGGLAVDVILTSADRLESLTERHST